MTQLSRMRICLKISTNDTVKSNAHLFKDINVKSNAHLFKDINE